ncbi:MAG: hypothetical protein WBO58_03065 [Gammaproteobacteria bacterium]
MTYVAPLWSASRLPCSTQRRRTYFLYYILLSVVMFALYAFARNIEYWVQGESQGFLRLFLQGFWAPGLWGDAGGDI